MVKSQPPINSMSDIDDLADFITQAHRSIEQVTDSAGYSKALASVTGAAEYRRLPDPAADDLLHHLERKRVEVVRASGALVP